jgi:diguanylate cyclase (GGDEF)-like protein
VQTLNKSYSARQKDHRTYLVVNSIACLGISVHIMFISLFLLLGLETLSIINIFSFFIWLIGWWVNRSGKHDLAIGLMTCEVIFHTSMVVPIMGWNAGFQYYLIGAIPFGLFNTRFSGKLIVFVSISLCLLFISLDAFTRDVIPALITPAAIKTINYINTAIAFAAIGVISYYFRVASLTLEQELELLAHTDSLTGLYNRRRMQELLELQIALFSRNQLKFSLIIVDIDHFKKINDTYGHFCGDYVLAEVASFMKKNLRIGDVIARWGGEKFLVMLPDTDINGARTVAENVRKAVAAKHFHLVGENFSVTMTFGLVQHKKENSLEESLKRADTALYEGKRAGCNRVIG